MRKCIHANIIVRYFKRHVSTSNKSICDISRIPKHLNFFYILTDELKIRVSIEVRCLIPLAVTLSHPLKSSQHNFGAALDRWSRPVSDTPSQHERSNLLRSVKLADDMYWRPSSSISQNANKAKNPNWSGK